MPNSRARESMEQAQAWTMHSAEVAVFDRNAEALGLGTLELMRHAAHALASCARDMLCGKPQRICLLCGPGNNGGDGFAAALLLQDWGYEVEIIASASKQKSPEAEEFRQQCVAKNIEIWRWPSASPTQPKVERELKQKAQRKAQDKILGCELLIDCLLGAGFSSLFSLGQKLKGQKDKDQAQPLRGSIAEILSLSTKLQQAHLFAPSSSACFFPQVLACDLPSGLSHVRKGFEAPAKPSTSKILYATKTLTFHAAKIHMFEDGQERSRKQARSENAEVQKNQDSLRAELGELCIEPLPWPAETLDCGPGEFCRLPPLDALARKGERGRVLIVGGGPYHGAPLLAALGAARSGCDLVHVAMPKNAAARCHWPLHLIAEILPGEPDYISIEGVDFLLQQCQRFDAVLIGPGLGRAEPMQDAIWFLVQNLIAAELPLVIDAEGLYVLAQKSPKAWPLTGKNPDSKNLKAMHGVLTPHRGELERWLGDLAPAQVLEDLYSKLAISNFEAEDQVILRTGATDLVVGHGGRLAHSRGGSPRMAMAGTGDLLSGICVSLLAQGMSPWAAARLASYAMRQVGNLAAADYGIGLVADDLPPYIARVFSKFAI